MGEIEWTGPRRWNPVRGCSRTSPGCENCYAERIAERFSDQGAAFDGYAVRGKGWTRKVSLLSDALDAPLRWRAPQLCFVNSTSDLFHERLSDDDIDRVFGAMWACLFVGRGDAIVDGHTFQVLTKRAARMRAYMSTDRRRKWADAAVAIGGGIDPDRLWDQTIFHNGPHPRIWLGVSVENQKYADERIPSLLETPAAVRFVSAEPLLDAVDLAEYLDPCGAPCGETSATLDWVIVGSESGPGSRPMDVAWARSIVDQCISANVPVFTKQIATEEGRRAGVPKGGDPAHWPPGEWPRQMPEASRGA